MPSDLRRPAGAPVSGEYQWKLINAWTGICDLFRSRYLDRLTFIHGRTWPVWSRGWPTRGAKMNFVGLHEAFSYIQMPSKLYTTPLRGWAIINRYFWHARHTMKNHHKDACGNQTIQAYCQNKNVLSECLKQTSFDYDTLRTKLQR